MSGWVIPVQYAMGVQKATRAASSNRNEETEQVTWRALNWLTQIRSIVQWQEAFKLDTIMGVAMEGSEWIPRQSQKSYTSRDTPRLRCWLWGAAPGGLTYGI